MLSLRTTPGGIGRPRSVAQAGICVGTCIRGSVSSYKVVVSPRGFRCFHGRDETTTRLGFTWVLTSRSVPEGDEGSVETKTRTGSHVPSLCHGICQHGNMRGCISIAAATAREAPTAWATCSSSPPTNAASCTQLAAAAVSTHGVQIPNLDSRRYSTSVRRARPQHAPGRG